MPEGEFDFLGYTFGRMYSARTGQARIGYRPSKKSLRRAVEKVHALTGRSRTWQETTTLVGKVNRMLRGWANYFSVGAVSKAYRALDASRSGAVAPVVRASSTKSRRGRSCHSSHLYGYFGLVRLTPAWARRRGRRREGLSESRMRAIRTSGSMSGVWKRSYG